MNDKPLDCIGIRCDDEKPVLGKHDFKFQPTTVNSGAPTGRKYKTVTLKKNGVPITAGDLKPGQIIEVDPETGEIT